MADCVFCSIADHSQTADILYEDDDVVAVPDIHPHYVTHLLVMPKKHLASAADMTAEDDVLVGQCMRIGAQLAKERGLDATGFRLLTNIGADAGQVVKHLHIHVMGGETLRPI